MPLQPYEYRDPETLLRTVWARRRLHDGEAAIVLVRDPSTAQDVVDIRMLPAGHRELERYELSRTLSRLADGMPIQDHVPPRYSIMTVVARRGLAVFGPNEARLLSAWLYANVFGTFKGGLMVVTPGGWVDFDTLWGGDSPRLRDPGKGGSRLSSNALRLSGAS